MSDGTTRSKYYGNQRAKDLTLRGVTGGGVGVFMVYGNRESSSGGPFFRDIQNQTGVHCWRNTVSINVASGSSDLSPWLSASWSYDRIELGN